MEQLGLVQGGLACESPTREVMGCGLPTAQGTGTDWPLARASKLGQESIFLIRKLFHMDVFSIEMKNYFHIKIST